MTEADSDFFFGRQRRDQSRFSPLSATQPDRLPVLLGNSGVGKSSLAQAGVLAALKRQAWPDNFQAAGHAWPQAFHDSRRWCFLTLEAGRRPAARRWSSRSSTLGSSTATDPERVTRQNGWIEILRERQGRAARPARRH